MNGEGGNICTADSPMIRDYYEPFNLSGQKRHYRDLYAGEEAAQAYVSWLDRFSWDFFATFTTGHTLTLRSARRAMEGFYNEIEPYFPDARMFWVAEPHEVKDGYHTHALLKCPTERVSELRLHQGVTNSHGIKSHRHEDVQAFNESVRFHYMRDVWQKVSGGRKGKKEVYCQVNGARTVSTYNRVQFAKYNPSRKAGGYVGKYILKQGADYDLL